MKTSEFLELSPREQDAIVGKEIFGGWAVDYGFGWQWPDKPGSDILPEYTTDIAAAWEVVEKDKDEFHFKHSAEADTPALAVCLAALKAVGFLE